MADNKDILGNPLAGDSIKGGIFFGSSLTPSGSFSNIPQTITFNPPTIPQTASIKLTLEELKAALQQSAKTEFNSTNKALSDKAVNDVITDTTIKLLIDYRDIRNFVFFGSAYTELAFNINYLIANYPYKAFLARPITSPVIELNLLNGGYTEIVINNTDLYLPGTYSYQEDGKTNWPGDISIDHSGFDVIDELGNRFPVVSFHSNAGALLTSATNATPIVLTTLNPHGFYFANITNATNASPIVVTSLGHGLSFGTQVIISGVTGNTAANGTWYVGNVTANTFGLFTDTSATVPVVGNGVYGGGGTIQLPTEVEVYDVQGNTAANGQFYAKILSSTTLSLYTNSALTVGAVGNGTFVVGDGARVRKVPLSYGNYTIRYKIKGNLSYNNLVNYQDVNTVNYKGIILSPKVAAITDFDLSITSMQKQLLAGAPINPTSWPREDVTENILYQGEIFDAWIASDNNFFLIDPNNPNDLLLAATYEYQTNPGLNLKRAGTLDETVTDQLARRAIPHRIIDETHDTEDGYFRRFVLLAGQQFDIIRSYITFLRYTKSLNYTTYNQLSPEYYKQYAQHFGFDLFDDESIDLANLIVRTEPGLRYDNLNNPVFDDRALAQTLKELQSEQQKRLLINIFQLYRTKGTQLSINDLTALLGAPEGLFVLREYAFQVNDLDELGYAKSYFNTTSYGGERVIDNEKVHVPKVVYEIDPDYLVNPAKINDPINLPYKYRMRLSNYETHNLREISIYTDPQNAIAQDVLGFGSVKYTYGRFEHRSYANLQDANKPYYLLPLTFPDKYYGVAVEYMIPRDGYEHGDTPNEKDKSNIHLASLFNVASLNVQPLLDISLAQSTPPINGQPIVVTTSTGPASITSISNATNSSPIIVTALLHGFTTGNKVNVTNVSGNLGANGIFYVNVLTPNTFELFLNLALTVPSVGTGAYTTGGLAQTIIPLAPHGYNTGDRVVISGVIGNTAANGIFTILTTSNTQFQLIGSTGSGVYSGGGQVRRLTPALRPVIDKYTYPGTLELRAIGEFTLSESLSFPKTISNATNTPTILINSVGHNLISYDRIRITDVNGNLATNGTHYVKFINANSFEIYQDGALTIGVTGSGAYTNGGQYVRVSNVEVRVETLPGSGVASTVLLASIPASDLQTTAFQIVDAINFAASYPEFTAEAIDNGDGSFKIKIRSEEGSLVKHNGKNIFITNSNLYPVILVPLSQKGLQDVELIEISNIVKLSGGRNPVKNGSFIINKLEGKDLVVRIGFNNETNLNSYKITSVVLNTPIEVNTSSMHHFNTGDRIKLRGIPTSFAYPDPNGVYTITKINATQFTLDNTAGTFSVAPTNAIGYFTTSTTTPISDGEVFEVGGIQFAARNIPATNTEFQAGIVNLSYASLTSIINAHPIASGLVFANSFVSFGTLYLYFTAITPGAIGNTIVLKVSASPPHDINGITTTSSTLISGTNGIPIIVPPGGTSYVPFEERVAISKNFFFADGLNHQLRLIYRARGVEVYQDFKFVEFLPWLDPTTSPSGPYTSLEIPKEEITNCTPLLFPILQFAAYPDNVQDYPYAQDEPKLWDLFCGLPRSIELNFLRVSVIESQTINHPDVIDIGVDLNTGYESEVYSFQFARQTVDQFVLNPQFNIQAVFRQPNPEVPGAVQDHYLPTGVDNIIQNLSLHSNDSLGGKVFLEHKQQHYHTVPDNELVNLETIFKYNAWHQSIHKNYTYDIAYGRALRNYEVFSNQVLTYAALLPFLKIVEEKFKKLISQFIPIVINLSDFGRIIKPNPFLLPKVHYVGIHDVCEGTTAKNYARATFTISGGTYAPGVNRIVAIKLGIQTIAGPFDFQSTKTVLAQQVASWINTNGFFATFNGSYNVVATQSSATIILEVDPNDYFNYSSGANINNQLLTIITSGDVTVKNISGFSNGQFLQNGEGCFKVTRTSPPIQVVVEENWVYYDSENGPETYIYFDSESIPPLYTN